MSLPETLSLVFLAGGAAAILRFVWLDSLRFADSQAEAGRDDRVSSGTARRLALQAEAAQVRADREDLPRAA